jgi:hypothetical protein
LSYPSFAPNRRNERGFGGRKSDAPRGGEILKPGIHQHKLVSKGMESDAFHFNFFISACRENKILSK